MESIRLKPCRAHSTFSYFENKKTFYIKHLHIVLTAQRCGPLCAAKRERAWATIEALRTLQLLSDYLHGV